MNTRGPAAIVTGASRGLGVGIAERLAAAGHPVVLVARGAEELERVAGAIRANGHQALAVAGDVTSEQDVDRIVAVTSEQFGTPGLLVNGAGTLPVVETLDELTWERFRRAIDIDVRGTFNAMRAVAPLLRARGAGTIVNLAAAAGGTAASPLHAPYSPSQAALLSLTRCTASWLAPAGVAVHCLCPSLTMAGGVGTAAATGFGAAEGLTPREWVERRFGSEAIVPGDVGDAVVALLDEPESRTWSVSPAGLTAWDPLPVAGRGAARQQGRGRR